MIAPANVKPIDVIFVDDSVAVRRFLQTVIGREKDLRVAATFVNGKQVVDHLRSNRPPDVLVLDVEMPELDGPGAVRAIRALGCRVPIIMFSTLTTRGQETTLRCLGFGANDYVAKPSAANDGDWQALGTKLIAKVRAHGHGGGARTPSIRPGPCIKAASLGTRTPTAASAGAPVGSLRVAQPMASRASNMVSHQNGVRLPSPLAVHSPVATVPGSSPRPLIRPDVVVIAASFGGAEALPTLIGTLGASPVPIVVVQHMPDNMTEPLRARLAQASKMRVTVAVDGAVAQPGALTLSPGWKHLTLRQVDGQVVCIVDDSAPVGGAKPSADRLLSSAARAFGSRALGVVLTGMGSDGLVGARALAGCGGQVIVQDKQSSAAWGMAGGIASAGLAAATLPLRELGEELRARLSAVDPRKPRSMAMGGRETCR